MGVTFPVLLTFALALFVGLVCAPRSAHAYPWMIRHEYTGCATCHVDPSGAGVLTAYGSAQGDNLLRTRYGASAGDAVSPSAGFLWGAVEPPAWFLPSGSIRTLALESKAGSAAFTQNLVIMQADLRAAIVSGGFRAYGSIGFVSSSGSAASLSGGLVSREHWLGWAFGADDAYLVRAGRIDLPFGVRQIEHTLFVRQATRTDLNDTQQHGVAIAYTGDLFRGEVMAIAGNYQVSPDAYRERGYSAYAEIAPLSNAAFGVSSLVTHAARDLYSRLPDTRQAHGDVRPLGTAFAPRAARRGRPHRAISDLRHWIRDHAVGRCRAHPGPSLHRDRRRHASRRHQSRNFLERLARRRLVLCAPRGCPVRLSKTEPGARARRATNGRAQAPRHDRALRSLAPWRSRRSRRAHWQPAGNSFTDPAHRPNHERCLTQPNPL